MLAQLVGSTGERLYMAAAKYGAIVVTVEDLKACEPLGTPVGHPHYVHVPCHVRIHHTCC